MKGGTRSLYWDIFKGLAILMVVFGHTGHSAGAYVYLFHLALFFFASGYLYNEKKYGDQPFLFLQKRIQGAWPRTALYCSLLALGHNFMARHGLLAVGTDQVYGPAELLSSILQGLLFQSPELLAGPMWFVPMWILGAALFGGSVWLGRQTGHAKGENAVILSCAFFGAVLGYALIGRELRISYGFELSFFVLPIFASGYFLRHAAGDALQKLSWPVLLLLMVLSLFGLHALVRHGIWFDLASRSVHGLWFFPGTAVGLLFSLTLTGLIGRLPRFIGEMFSFLGRHSFDIMALHVFFFKLLDMLLRKLYFRDPAMDLRAYPSPLSAKYWLLYTIAATALSVLVGWGIDVFCSAWRDRFSAAAAA